QRGGLAEACSEQQAEDTAVGELQLGVWWQVLVDDAGDTEALEQRCDEGQRSEGAGLVGARDVLQGEGHKASSDWGRRGMAVARRDSQVQPHRTSTVKPPG